MKTYSLFVLLVLTTVLFFSTCKKEEVISTTSSISLRNLQVGQQITYRKIYVEFDINAPDPAGSKDCNYGTDMLIFEVLRKEGDGFIVKEYLKTQSADDVGELLLVLKNNTVDVVQMEEPSRYGPSLFHQKTFSIAAVDSPLGSLEKDCFYTNPPAASESFGIAEASVGTASLKNLYAYTFDGALALDGPGYTYLFDEEAVLLRSTTYGEFFPYLNGWEIILE